jgi:hypothetical protein
MQISLDLKVVCYPGCFARCSIRIESYTGRPHRLDEKNMSQSKMVGRSGSDGWMVGWSNG